MGLNAAAEASITIAEAVGDTRVDQILDYFFQARPGGCKSSHKKHI